MDANALDPYVPWVLQPVALPSPSRLYRLPPLGLGTPQVEGLTSYITRLAAAHTVAVRHLVVQELLPLLGRPHLSGTVNNSLSAFWQRDSPALNGMGALAHDWTDALERVTQWPALDRLTLLPWAAALPTHGLLRRTRAWCAACYAQWRQHGQDIYEPLQWHLMAVTACAQHHQMLTERCPQAGCQRSQPPLGPRAQAGHCAFCGAWLGASDPPVAVAAADLGWAVWVAQAVGALLAAGGASLPPHRAEVGRQLAARIDEQGGRTHCARVLGLPLSTICQWHQGTHLPQLGSLLRLCAALGTTPLQVLTGHDAAPAPYVGVPPPHAGPARRPRPGAFPTAQIQQRLEEVVCAEAWPPPSMRQVAHQLNYAHADLLRRFPTLCRAISARYLAYRTTEGAHKLHQLRDAVWQATHAVHAQGLYPSSCRVAQLLGTPSHFRHPLANAAWHDALRDLGWET